MQHKSTITVKDRKPLSAHIAELWQHREVLYFLTWRNTMVRYKQTLIGIMWSILRPALATFVLVLVFHRFIGLQSENTPYALVVISGLLLWHLFANSVSSGGTSLAAEQTLVTRIYVPRLILPISAMLVNTIEAVITFIIILLLMQYYDVAMGWQIIFAPAIVLLTFILALAVSMSCCALHARYRDFVYIIPFFLQIGFYLSPIAFLAIHVPEDLRWLYYFNPMVGLVESFRWSLFAQAGDVFPLTAFLYSLGITIVLGYLSLMIFFKMERTIADVL